MPSAEAHIPTQHADRHLNQLCRHANAISQRTGQHPRHESASTGDHPRLRRIERSDSAAILDFDRGRCLVRAEPAALALRVEAEDPTSLARIEQLIAADIGRFGAREHLTVTWRDVTPSTTAQ